MIEERGNITIDIQELESLRKGLIDKYSERSGIDKEIIALSLNSVIGNYKSLYNDINSNGAFDAIQMKSAKPLLDLFYSSSLIRKSKAAAIFRKKFVNVLYLYAFGKSREAWFTTKPANDYFHKLVGFWECYYSQDNFFKNIFESKGKATLRSVALQVTSYSPTRCNVDFYQQNNWGQGYVEWFGSNLSFVLKSDANKEPIYLLMNCGRTLEDSAREHLKKAVGFCVYINESSSPKSVKCVMRSFTEQEVRDFYELDDIDIKHKQFQEKFKGTYTLTKDDELNPKKAKLIEFFKKNHLSSDANIFEYTSVD